MKKSLIVTITILLFCIFMATAVMADDKGLVYYLSPGQFDEMYVTGAAAMVNAVEKAGYTCKVMTATNEDVNVQMDQMDDAITQNPVAIIIMPVESSAAAAGVDKARAAGIPVISYDRVISETTLDFTSVAGCYQMGVNSAHEIVNLLQKKNGEVRGSILDIMGDPGDSYTILIEQGFRDIMKDYPDVKIETKIALAWDPVNAGNIADDYLLANPEVDLIFIHADVLAPAVVSVLETKGFKKGDVILVSTSGQPAGLALIRNGWLSLTIEESIIALAEAIAMYLDDIISGNEIKLGPVEIMGLQGEIIEQPYGIELQMAGLKIDAENVDDPIFWGNQAEALLNK